MKAKNAPHRTRLLATFDEVVSFRLLTQHRPALGVIDWKDVAKYLRNDQDTTPNAFLLAPQRYPKKISGLHICWD